MRSVSALLAIATTASAIDQGPLHVTVDGVVKELRVVALAEKESGLFDGSGDSLSMTWGGEVRGFLAEKQMDDMPSNNYFNFTLFNKELSYDLDLSAVGCSCNAALFFASMPGYNEDGSVAKGAFNPYYCDANKVGGVWCWEHDTIESNKYTLASTPHTCNSNPGTYISDCDRRGCPSSSYSVDPKGLCPDASCKIDSSKPFRLHQSFEGDPTSTKLVRIGNKLVQGSNTFEFDVCADPDYLERMTPAFKGEMAMVFQLWGDTYDTMTWLDDMTNCTGDCVAGETSVSFSNLVLKTLPATEAQGTEAPQETVVVV